MVRSRHRRSGVAARVTRGHRRHGRMPRAGYNYYPGAVPVMVVTVADTAGKGRHQDSDYDCNY